MILRPDHLLGRDFIFNRADRVGTVRSRVTVVAHDPVKGWRLSSAAGYTPAWVPDSMFRQLLTTGVLEAA